MHKNYAKFFEGLLIQHMENALPLFHYLDASERRKIGGLWFWGPGKLHGFMWNPVDSLIFIIKFRDMTSRSSFDSEMEWSETGKVIKEQQYKSENALYTEETLNLSHAITEIQALSIALGETGNNRVIGWWKIWTPSVPFDDEEAWCKELIADMHRALPDDEAKERVDASVSKAVFDIQRCALPWFEAKLKAYMNKKQQIRLGE